MSGSRSLLKMTMILLKTILFTVLVPGTVTIVVPLLLLSSSVPQPPGLFGVFRYVGFVLILLGSLIYLCCAWDFLVAGRGTPAPLDPPKELVDRRLYRYVRNPMYIGVMSILFGESLLFESVVILIYSVVVFCGFFLFVLLYEEPTLMRQFGSSYGRYLELVPRWIPSRGCSPGSPRQKPASPGRKVMGYRLMVGLGLLVSLLIFGAGLGLPYTYWLHMSDLQVFEGTEGVTLFIEVERTMRYPGFLQEAPIRTPVSLYRIDVSGDGMIKRQPLKFSGRRTFNTNISPILRLQNAFYLVEGPSMGRPYCQLHVLKAERIESLTLEESDTILRSVGLRCGSDDFKEFDEVTQRNGWRRLNRESYGIGLGYMEPIVSKRHGVRLRFVEDGQLQEIVAESLSGTGRWAKSLVSVSTMPWKSYESPLW